MSMLPPSPSSSTARVDDEGQAVHGHWARLPQLEDLPSEDVSVGFWLEAVNHTKMDMPVSIHPSACNSDKKRHLVIDHYVSPDDMRLRWCRYLAAGDPCAEVSSCEPP